MHKCTLPHSPYIASYAHTPLTSSHPFIFTHHLVHTYIIYSYTYIIRSSIHTRPRTPKHHIHQAIHLYPCTASYTQTPHTPSHPFISMHRLVHPNFTCTQSSIYIYAPPRTLMHYLFMHIHQSFIHHPVNQTK